MLLNKRSEGEIKAFVQQLSLSYRTSVFFFLMVFRYKYTPPMHSYSLKDPGDGEGQGGLACCSPWGR